MPDALPRPLRETHSPSWWKGWIDAWADLLKRPPERYSEAARQDYAEGYEASLRAQETKGGVTTRAPTSYHH